MGMRPIRFVVDTFSNPQSKEDLERSRLVLLALAQALCKIDEIYLLYNPRTPRLYDTDVVYHVEEDTKTHSDDEWCDIPTVLRAGWGDCDDLASYLVAERRVYDQVEAEPVIKWRYDGRRYIYHMLVTSPQFGTEDPSKVLGMGTAEAEIPLDKFEAMIRARRKRMRVAP